MFRLAARTLSRGLHTPPSAIPRPAYLYHLYRPNAARLTTPPFTRAFASAKTTKTTKTKKAAKSSVAKAKSTPDDTISPSTDAGPPLSKLQLRDYQEECITAVLNSIASGHKRLGVSLATGSGKTVIFTQLISRIPPRNETATQSLILVHRKELVEQAANHCLRAYPGKSIDIEMGNAHATGAADITIASVKSMLSKDRMRKFDPGRFKLVLVDEAHHIVAKSYRDVLAYFNLSEAGEESPVLVGVSATFSRFDGLKLGAAIDYIVYHKDYIDMIKDKWLADAVFTTIKSYADLSRVSKASGGDFNTTELSIAVNTETINDIIVRSWLQRASHRRSTLVFGVDIEHVRCLTEAFRKQGVDARYITSKSPKDLRTKELEAFRNFEFPVLLNCGLFTEGTDIPNIDCVILARPTRSKNLLIQMVGRGLRLYPGKKDCHIIDIVGSLETGIVTTPTLFGLHPDEGLKEVSAEDMDKLKDKDDDDPLVRRRSQDRALREDEVSVEVTDYDSIHDLLADDTREKHIRAISNLAWVPVSRNRFVLETRTGKLVISKEGQESYKVHYAMALLDGVSGLRGKKAQSPLGKLREIASSPTFDGAVHAADTFANRTFPAVFTQINQGWRHKYASVSQLHYINARLPEGMKLEWGTLKKGEAMDMITKFKHGAAGEFEKIMSVKRRREKAARKEEELRERETVTVGPLN